MDQPLRYKEVTSLGEVCQTIKMDSNGFVGCGRCVVCSGVMDLHMASKTLNPMDLRLAYMLYHVLVYVFFCNFPEPKVLDPEVGL